ncbi:hypothetical protein EZV62_007879 [Acer yangbiense]|uniref:Uncharacterized protein n=1 Tax=Acer yangbiense TaxID=1000413 RepID=A0A5C7IBS6_9ROSI|nr:hypothetical protein EZV62_007879 [Acer yangbiense]
MNEEFVIGGIVVVIQVQMKKLNNGFFGNPGLPLNQGTAIIKNVERDFNELLSVKDKLGGSAKSFAGMFQFRQATDDCDLSDLGFSGRDIRGITEGKVGIIFKKDWIDSLLIEVGEINSELRS